VYYFRFHPGVYLKRVRQAMHDGRFIGGYLKPGGLHTLPLRSVKLEMKIRVQFLFFRSKFVFIRKIHHKMWN
jgi:hypothetical protein